jgi:hypothetical protein
MSRTEHRILKASQVRPGRPLEIGCPAPAQRRCGADPGAALAAPSARIVQESDGLAVIEVTCGCGSTIRLHCRYAAEPAGQAPAALAADE